MELKRIEKRQKAPYDGDLCRAIFPIYYFGKLCGVVPVRFYVRASEGCQARLNIIDLVYSLCALILLLGAEIWGLWRDMKDGWEHSTRLKSRTAMIATWSDVLGVMSLTVVCIVGSPFRWKSLQLVINKLIEVDRKIGVSSAKKARRFTICLTICSLVLLWFNSCLDFYSWSRKTKNETLTDKGPINYAPLYVMYTVIISTEIQYSVATYNIGQRFVRLNSSLKSMLDTNNSNNDDAIGYFRKFSERANDIGDKKGWNITPKRQLVLGSYRLSRKMDESKTYVSSISELIMVHSLLCDTVSLINAAFGVVLLAVTISCLLHLVITPYFLIVQANEKHEWIFLVVQVGWCIFHISRMLIIVQPSYSTVAEGKKTAALVSQLLSCCFEADARRELEIFSLQLLHRPLEFSACGLFSLDRNLITSIAGVITTYLVILVQY
ncbi:gustatory receptor for sugar taste 43a-like [Bombus affinis]|uniref:gustatory receptor for sugar taste 43a-like n=1 Tax=Bombus affinis TaxID=309941 RepID=UPI0021B770AB|nr:gustatory receptor for sugar taste 43a-like [Bombus affinis]XP_050597292.1 gustatory receptor for sugar taste 43a-like [Bombus affinis]